MKSLCDDFPADGIVSIDLAVPAPILTLMSRISDMTQAADICIGGGFVRGLYMQAHMGLNPGINDIDFFVDMSVPHFHRIRPALESLFGHATRFHIGQFEKEPRPRGLIDFEIPADHRPFYATADSIQLNFGPGHVWAKLSRYIAQSNLGINRIGIDRDGQVLASQAFIKDMHHKTMTMNPDLDWTIHNWSRTIRIMKRFGLERPEFENWQSILVPHPAHSIAGSFWQNNEGPVADVANGPPSP
ncbi:MAG: hypothetical protein V4621_01135 [Pseudomonadota bacterium]